MDSSEKMKETKIHRIITNAGVTFIIGVCISILQFVPDTLISPIYLLCIVIVIVIITLFIAFGREFYQDAKKYINDKAEFEYLIEGFTNYIQIKKELIEINLLNDNGDADIKRCLHVKNISKNDIEIISIPWFYEIYDDKIADKYRPDIKDVTILYLDFICRNKGYSISNPDQCLHPEGIIDFGNNKPREARGWIFIPLKDRLRPDKEIKINIFLTQKYIYNRMNIKEAAGILITSLTKELIILINPPEGKKISPVTIKDKSVEINYTILDLPDKDEFKRVEAPSFQENSAKWIVNAPKVGNMYLLLFKII